MSNKWDNEDKTSIAVIFKHCVTRIVITGDVVIHYALKMLTKSVF